MHSTQFSLLKCTEKGFYFRAPNFHHTVYSAQLALHSAQILMHNAPGKVITIVTSIQVSLQTANITQITADHFLIYSYQLKVLTALCTVLTAAGVNKNYS